MDVNNRIICKTKYLTLLFMVDSVGKMPRMFHSLLLFTFHLSLVTAENQCRTEVNMPGVALRGFVFKNMTVTAPSRCDAKCLGEITCQSYNYHMEKNICELNNRTKEARPENLRSNTSWFYIRRLIERGKNFPKIDFFSSTETNLIWS